MDLALLSDVEFDKLINLSGLIPALIILLLTYVLLRFSKNFFEDFGERHTKYRLLLKQSSVFLQFTLLLTGLFLALGRVLEIDQSGIQFIVGLVAFGLSWASKDLIASLMAGIILLFDNPFQVGDRITFQGFYGEVVELGLRSVRVVDLDDNLISIPNNQFLQSAVSCANAGNLDQMCVFRFFIGCREDFFLAEEIIHEGVAASRYLFWKKAIVVHMEEGAVPNGAERFAIILTAKAYVIDGRFETEFASDVHRRVKRAFQEAGIRTAGELEWEK